MLEFLLAIAFFAGFAVGFFLEYLRTRVKPLRLLVIGYQAQDIGKTINIMATTQTFPLSGGPITFLTQLADNATPPNLLGDATAATVLSVTNVVGDPGSLTGNVFTPTGVGSFDLGGVNGALTGSVSVTITDAATQLIITGSQAPAVA